MNGKKKERRKNEGWKEMVMTKKQCLKMERDREESKKERIKENQCFDSMLFFPFTVL